MCTMISATHFKFIREIPIFAQYEMRMSLAAWDNKWVRALNRAIIVK
jgi:hypothetical protein